MCLSKVCAKTVIEKFKLNFSSQAKVYLVKLITKTHAQQNIQSFKTFLRKIKLTVAIINMNDISRQVSLLNSTNNGDWTGSMVNYILTDTTQQGSPDCAQTTCTHNNWISEFILGCLCDYLPWLVTLQCQKLRCNLNEKVK